MTGNRPASEHGTCDVLPPALVAAYADGGLRGAQAWSVEAHLPGCAACRAVLASPAQAARLARNKAVVLTRTGLPQPGLAGRALARCGVPRHLLVLLSATPSLRRSWLAGVTLVLAAALGAARLAQAVAGSGAAGGGAAAQGPLAWSLMPFLVLAPLLTLVAVAAAFSARLDPAGELAVAAPVSKAWLLLVRSVAVTSTTLVPTVLAALALPGPWWLPVTALGWSLALSTVALAAATVAGPVRGAAAAGAAWLLALLAVALVAGSPAPAFGQAGQTVTPVILAAGVLVTALRRRQIDPAWMR